MFRYENDKPQKEGFPAQVRETSARRHRIQKMAGALPSTLLFNDNLVEEMRLFCKTGGGFYKNAPPHDDAVLAFSMSVEDIIIATSDLRPAPWYHRFFNWLRSCFPGAAKNIVE